MASPKALPKLEAWDVCVDVDVIRAEVVVVVVVVEWLTLDSALCSNAFAK